SGTAALAYGPAWNYDLMSIGYWLATLPTLLIVAGFVVGVVEFFCRPSVGWFLLFGFGFFVGFSMLYFFITVPYFATVKAFHGLSALVPLCACAAAGWQALSRRSAPLRAIVCLLFGMWAINSYASFWMSRSSVPALLGRARYLFEEGRYREASQLLNSREPL